MVHAFSNSYSLILPSKKEGSMKRRRRRLWNYYPITKNMMKRRNSLKLSKNRTLKYASFFCIQATDPVDKVRHVPNFVLSSRGLSYCPLFLWTSMSFRHLKLRYVYITLSPNNSDLIWHGLPRLPKKQSCTASY